jgi:hypothetical protein
MGPRFLAGYIIFYPILAVRMVAYMWSRRYALGMLAPAWTVFVVVPLDAAVETA